MLITRAIAISRITRRLFVLCALLFAMSQVFAAIPVGGNWAGWRGDGTGVSLEAKLPLSWSATTNVLWRTPLPGEGSSSPIIWGEQAFVIASSAGGTKRLVLSLNIKDGTIRWQRELAATKAPQTDDKSGYAPATPVTDGQRVYAFFDSPGLVALDMEGNVLWTLPLGPFKTQYNITNSPILDKDTVIMVCDHNGDSFIIAVDKATGLERWRTPRKQGAHYATPLLINSQGKSQIIVDANTVRSYDADTGKELWSCAGLASSVSPSPIFDHGLVLATSGRNGPTMAIDPGGSGDVKETHVRMQLTTGGPYVISPLACPTFMIPGDDGNIRFVDDNGKIVYNLLLRSHFTASPVLGGAYVYWVAENGDTFIIDIHALTSATPVATVIGKNSLGEQCLASPAIASGCFFIRTVKALYCLAGDGPTTAPPTRTITETFAELKKRFDEHPEANGPDIPVRLSIIEDLGVQQDPQAIPFLKKVALDDPHWDVSEAAIKVLAQYNNDAAIPELLTMFVDWRPYLKVPAAQALGRLRAVGALPTLLKGMRDGDAQVRIACTEAVAQITLVDTVDSATTLPALLDRLGDNDGAVRAAGALSLGILSKKAGIDRNLITSALVKAATSINPIVVTAAKDALKLFNFTPERIEEMINNLTLYGDALRTSTARDLTAGPIRVKYQDGELRYLYVGDKEIVRRVYFAVRDMQYDTIMPQFTQSTITQENDSFTIQLEASCKSKTADYSWTGEIIGTADGKITFKVLGKPNSVFASPRIGICVLFGTPSLAGQDYTVIGNDGKKITGNFPKDVVPGVFIPNFSTISYSTPDGIEVNCGITGQGFNMEDQRNFGDSSYKAYHTLAYKFYTDLTVGDEHGDMLTVSVRNAAAKPYVEIPINITVGEQLDTMKLPKISSTAKPATTDSFVTINNSRDKFKDVKSIAWGFNPAVHMPDEDTFMENLPSIIDQVRTARTFLPAETPIRIDPVNFDSPYLRLSRDSRNQGLFGAAWFTAAIANISMAGVDEVVTTIGPGPVDLLVKDLAAYAGQPLLNVSLTASSPKPVEAFGIKDGDGAILWVINMTNKPQRCAITLPAGKEATSVRRLNTMTMSSPDVKNEAVPAGLTMTLTPYEVYRVTIAGKK